MKNWKWLLACLVVLGALTGGYVLQQLNKAHRDYAGERPVAKTIPQDLLADFEADLAQANLTFVNQVIQLHGVLSDLEGETFALEGGVIGQWAAGHEPAGLKTGALIQLKGRVLAYDDLFSEVRMDEAVLLMDAQH